MPVVNLLMPLGTTTTAQHCGNCPHLRAGDRSIFKRSRYCVMFRDCAVSDSDGTSYLDHDQETTERLAVCIERTHGGAP